MFVFSIKGNGEDDGEHNGDGDVQDDAERRWS